MKTINAIFVKQSKDMFRNIGVLVMFVVFPVIALAMTNLIAVNVPDMADDMFVSMMAAMFIGMALMMSVSTIISEDIENKSLKFLTIAGVKPMSYIIGIGGVVFVASIFTSGAFGLIGGVRGGQFIGFMTVMLSGAIASILLGAIIGLLAKNQQAATGLSMPIGMALGLGPLAAGFNETVARVFSIFYTQQVSLVIENPGASLSRPLSIIWINVAVLAIVFAIVYSRAGKQK
ncbi:MAG: ABC transporter permease [Oscillospiraceae bacterium]|nr:ABC transporter permease [Oscillospiraceae bacterium]